jgi:hypothetical protein
MSKGHGFRLRALQSLERAERATDPAMRRDLEKLADSYLKLADQADGMRPPHTHYPGDGTDEHVS